MYEYIIAAQYPSSNFAWDVVIWASLIVGFIRAWLDRRKGNG